MHYIIKRRKVAGYSLWNKAPDGFESFIGDYPTIKQAKLVGSILAGWGGKVEVVK